jgi:hypothetical protein
MHVKGDLIQIHYSVKGPVPSIMPDAVRQKLAARGVETGIAVAAPSASAIAAMSENATSGHLSL